MKPDSIELEIPIIYSANIELEDECEKLPDNPTRQDVLRLLTKEHFDKWYDSLMEGLYADWDKESYVQSWREDNDWDGRAKIKIGGYWNLIESDLEAGDVFSLSAFDEH